MIYSDVLKQEFENQDELDKAELAYYRQTKKQEEFDKAAVKAMLKWFKDNCGIDERYLKRLIATYKEYCEVNY